jgi:hypothetical protein
MQYISVPAGHMQAQAQHLAVPGVPGQHPLLMVPIMQSGPPMMPAPMQQMHPQQQPSQQQQPTQQQQPE